jgi:hypothetical protein
MNPFDKLKRQMTATLTTVMGYNVTWIDSISNTTFIKRVFFQYPDRSESLQTFDYMPNQPRVEYLEGDFPNLKSYVDSGSQESVLVEDKGEFFVTAVERKYDGDYLIAYLKEKI